MSDPAAWARVDDAVTARSRPLDTLTRAEAETLVAAAVAAGEPVRFALSLAGEVELHPADPGDGLFGAVLADRLRPTGDPRELGPEAAAVVGDLFRAAGWTVLATTSPSLGDVSDAAVVRGWLGAGLTVAVHERPALREWAQEYRASRRAQLRAGTLRIVVPHTDLLASPQ